MVTSLPSRGPRAGGQTPRTTKLDPRDKNQMQQYYHHWWNVSPPMQTSPARACHVNATQHPRGHEREWRSGIWLRRCL